MLALGWFLPSVVDIYSFGGLPLVLYIPAYLVTIVLFDGVLSLENAVYAIEPFIPVRGGHLWDAGLLVTFYLFAVTSTWVGRYLRNAETSIKLDESHGEGGPPS